MPESGCFQIESGSFEMRVFWSDEDDGYIAVASDLPGRFAFGKTWPEAVIELQSIMTQHVKMTPHSGAKRPISLTASKSDLL